MIANHNAIDTPSRGRRRPLGVWLFTICHTVYAVAGIFSVSPGLEEPVPHGWGPDAATAAWSQIALLVALLISAWGTWSGSRHARIGLLLVLTITIGVALQQDYFAIPYMIARAKQEPQLWLSVAFWWGMSTGLRLISWLALNYWYFLGRQTRDFFSRRSHVADDNAPGL